MPAPGIDADVDGGCGLERFVSGELDLAQRKLLCSSVQGVGDDLTRGLVHHGLELEEF